MTSYLVGGITQDDPSSSSSSSQTLVNSSPPVHHLANQERDTQVAVPPNSCLPAFNNFLLQQDPQTGRITLLPVHVAAGQPLTELDLSSLPLTTGSGQTQPSDHHISDTLNGSFKSVPGFTGLTASRCQTNLSAACPDDPSACAHTRRAQVKTTPRHRKPDPSRPLPHQACCPALLQVIALLREQFAYDGYMENGVHDLAMGT